MNETATRFISNNLRSIRSGEKLKTTTYMFLFLETFCTFLLLLTAVKYFEIKFLKEAR